MSGTSVLRKARRLLGYLRSERDLSSQLNQVERYLGEVPRSPADVQPVIFFNASTRIRHLSLNGAFSLLASWGLRTQGDPVRYVMCQHAMSQCVLGAVRYRPLTDPPCRSCTGYSQRLFPSGDVVPLNLDRTTAGQIEKELIDYELRDLKAWTINGLDLGEICLPSVRWVLRRHHLSDDEETRELYRRYLASAASLVGRFERMFSRLKPRAVVVFNGLTYPEAVARAVAKRSGIRAVTHEVGLLPNSAFFSHQEATFREVLVPEHAQLTSEQDARLDSYLQDRHRGKFSMAGIQFWPSMHQLPDAIGSAVDNGRKLVTVFTNVVFDTSQVHANVLFDDMFDWLDSLVDVFGRHSGTLFVIRAHPDEDRPGKASRESVADWVSTSGVIQRSNVFFLAPSDYASSYELIRRSRLVLVYSSSIGLEASIEGTPVLCAGRARYTQNSSVILPTSRTGYFEELERLLSADEIGWPSTRVDTARAFLFAELFRASLDLSEFLRPYPEAPGMVLFKDFRPERLASHPALGVVRRGIMDGTPFLLESPMIGSGEPE